ncbi:MAG TPA: PAS domain S-box protein [Terracidiphilus sp.]|nr:PAS domain S-box protein [Terracidiphilus sp.]
MHAMLGFQLAEDQEALLRPELPLLDRSPDPALDELTGLAAELCGADYAYIGWMDEEHLTFKSRFGFEAPDQPRDLSACQWTLKNSLPLLIPHVGKDGRFPRHGIELQPGVRCLSYAGVPLLSSSQQVIGTLAVLATAANRFNQTHLKRLVVLSHQAITRLELYGRTRMQEHAQLLRLRTERALAIERCMVTETLDSIPALVTVLDIGGRVARINEPCAQLTGLNRDEVVGRPFVDEFLESDDREWATARLREAAAGQPSGPHETVWQSVADLARKTTTGVSGKRRVSWTVKPLEGPNHEVQYLIISGQDVTGRRAIEQALMASEDRYREMVENSLGFVFACSMEGRPIAINDFTAETLGYNPSTLKELVITELMDSAGAAAFQDCLRALDTFGEWQGAFSIRRSDGVIRRIAVRSRRIDVPGGNAFALCNGMDVTEQHDSEEALHLAMRQRELILESAGDGIFGIDLEGKITFMNNAGAELLSYTPDQLAGNDAHDLIHHSHPDGTPYSRTASPILLAMRRAESIWMRDEVFWRKDGTAVPVEYTANPLIEEGHISGMVVAFQDVTERRRLERMKEEFISTVSHELRTPLTALRASLGLIASGSLDSRPEKQKQMIQMAIGNSERLMRLVNNILDFDRGEKGRLALRRKHVEADDLLRRAAEAAETPAALARIAIKVDAAATPVYADEDRILQVFKELLTNAIKFSEPGTTIQLSAQLGGMSALGLPELCFVRKGEVCFIVEDEGAGIPPEKLARIFERFQQGDGSDTRALGGTGLGLALCRSIVEAHGGRIWADSTVGQGSRFYFTLPILADVEVP